MDDHDDKNLEDYRPCIGIILLNKENDIFVAQRSDIISEYWQMPQGGIEENEPIEEAAFRELKEETSITSAEIMYKIPRTLVYDFPSHNYTRKLYNGKYRGQKQTWFIMRFLGNDSEINLETPVPEFRNWRWEYLENMEDICIPFKVKLYCTLQEEIIKFLEKTS